MGLTDIISAVKTPGHLHSIKSVPLWQTFGHPWFRCSTTVSDTVCLLSCLFWQCGCVYQIVFYHWSKAFQIVFLAAISSVVVPAVSVACSVSLLKLHKLLKAFSCWLAYFVTKSHHLDKPLRHPSIEGSFQSAEQTAYLFLLFTVNDVMSMHDCRCLFPPCLCL